MLKPQEISQLVLIVRRAPLHNMEEAENVSRLLDKTVSVLRQVLLESTAKTSTNSTEETKADDERANSGGP